ncbi:MAG: hypothetical protein AB7U20_22605, partial [Planctomycetaceae bacterium]
RTDHPTPFKRAVEVLRPQKCYSVLEVQDLVGLSVTDLLAAVQTGEIPRSLGEGMETQLLGIDVVDWLTDRPQSWPDRHSVDADADEPAERD